MSASETKQMANYPAATAVPVQENQGGYQQAVPVATVYTTQFQPGGSPVAVVHSGVSRGDQVFYSSSPQRIICQFCNYEVITAVSVTPGATAWLWSLVLFCIGCWPLCLLPFCMCMDSVHTCPNCRRIVGMGRS